MFHIELRQFPHNLCRFNLEERELYATVVEPWARERWIELGERKWSPHQAKLTVLEGPRIPVEQLSMGRGWRNAQRQSEDVTMRVLAAVTANAVVPERAPMAAADVPAADVASAESADARSATSSSESSSEDTPREVQLVADSLGLELLSLLGGQLTTTMPLAHAWRLAGERYPERSPSECLRLAEEAVRSLLRSELIVLREMNHSELEPESGEEATQGWYGAQESESILRAIDSWSGERSTRVRIRRA
jgi:hypothetical protein